MPTRAAFARKLGPELALLGASAGLCLFYSRYYYVGRMMDDAVYVIGARSLLQGDYAMLSHPLRPPLTDYAPGLPLFLAPFVAFLGPRWGALELVAIGVTLASFVAALRLFRPWLSPGTALVFLALYAFNAGVAATASYVMTESLFVLLTLTLFCLLRPAIRTQAPWLGWLMGILLGWAMLVRPNGAILAPAVGAGLAYHRRWKTAARALGAASAIWGAAVLHNLSVSRSPSGDWPRFVESAGYLADPAALIDNWNRVTNLLFCVAPFGIRLPYSFAGFAVSAAVFIALLALMREGARDVVERKKEEGGLVLAAVLYCAGYYLIQSLWAAIDVRYALPVLPFILAFTVAGVERLLRRARREPSPRAVTLIVAAFVAWTQAQSLRHRSQRAQEPRWRFPEKTMEWIRGNTSAAATLIGSRAQALYLYTGRLAVSAPNVPVNDQEEYRYQLLRERVGYFVDEPCNVLYRPRKNAVHPEDLIRQQRSWVSSWPSAFRTVYKNDLEGTTVYEVVDDPEFVGAFDLYLEARRQFDGARFDAGFRSLDAALAAQPRLVKALNAYGAASLISGKRLAAGEAKLKRAVEVDPDYFWAWMNLARLYRRTGRIHAAKDALIRADASLRQFPNLREMRPVIFKEAAELGALPGA